MEHKKYYYKKHKDDESPISVIKTANTAGDEVKGKNTVLNRVHDKKTEEIRSTKEEQ